MRHLQIGWFITQQEQELLSSWPIFVLPSWICWISLPHGCKMAATAPGVVINTMISGSWRCLFPTIIFTINKEREPFLHFLNIIVPRIIPPTHVQINPWQREQEIRGGGGGLLSFRIYRGEGTPKEHMYAFSKGRRGLGFGLLYDWHHFSISNQTSIFSMKGLGRTIKWIYHTWVHV